MVTYVFIMMIVSACFYLFPRLQFFLNSLTQMQLNFGHISVQIFQMESH